jgi:hypothetical protein
LQYDFDDGHLAEALFQRQCNAEIIPDEEWPCLGVICALAFLRGHQKETYEMGVAERQMRVKDADGELDIDKYERKDFTLHVSKHALKLPLKDFLFPDSDRDAHNPLCFNAWQNLAPKGQNRKRSAASQKQRSTTPGRIRRPARRLMIGRPRALARSLRRGRARIGRHASGRARTGR